MRYFKGVTLLLVVLTSGCSITPYRGEFACSLKDDYGKCIDVHGAYNEAVTGVDSGAPRLSRKGKQVEPLVTPPSSSQAPRIQNNSASPIPGDLTLAVNANTDEYGAYRSAVYQQMRAMLASPTSPMVRPAQTVRTLIISYSNRRDSRRLYMPRYVFSISEGPQFVMGEYLNHRSDLIPTSVVKVSQESMMKGTH